MKTIMTLRLDINPAVEETLTQQARLRGLSLDAYLQRVIEELATIPDAPPADLRELRTTLDALAQLGTEIPPTPGTAFSREVIYQDHD